MVVLVASSWGSRQHTWGGTQGGTLADEALRFKRSSPPVTMNPSLPHSQGFTHKQLLLSGVLGSVTGGGTGVIVSNAQQTSKECRHFACFSKGSLSSMNVVGAEPSLIRISCGQNSQWVQSQGVLGPGGPPLVEGDVPLTTQSAGAVGGRQQSWVTSGHVSTFCTRLFPPILTPMISPPSAMMVLSSEQR